MTWSVLPFEVGLQYNGWTSFPARRPSAGAVPGRWGLAKTVSVDDEYEVKTESKKWLIKVADLLHSRVQYSEAIKYYIDITPAEEIERIKFQSAVFHTGKRMSKVGRPTKKQKRDLDEFTSGE